MVATMLVFFVGCVWLAYLTHSWHASVLKGKQASKPETRAVPMPELLRKHRWRLNLPHFDSRFVSAVKLAPVLTPWDRSFKTADGSTHKMTSTRPGKARFGELEVEFLDDPSASQLTSALAWLEDPNREQATVTFFDAGGRESQQLNMAVKPIRMEFSTLSYSNENPATFVVVFKVINVVLAGKALEQEGT